MTVKRRIEKLEAQAQPQETGVVSVVVYSRETGEYLTPVDPRALKLILIADDGSGDMLGAPDWR